MLSGENKKILILDAYNLMHRARHSMFGKGKYATTFNFFRGLKPILEKFSPDETYFVLEGQPKARLVIHPEYKANRKVGLTPEKIKKNKEFAEQREVICEIMSYLPITIVRHEDFECDDVIGGIAMHWHPDDDVTIVSNDTDFIQLLSNHENLKLWSPITKKFREKTEYDYVDYKSLVGDTADNISGVPRVGKKTAVKILNKGIDNWVKDNPEKALIYQRNTILIKLDLPEKQMDKVDILFKSDDYDFDVVKLRFESMEFSSMLGDKYWSAFVSAFF